MITVTEATNEFVFATATATSGTTVSVSQTCTITSGIEGTCVASYEEWAGGKTTRSVVTTSFTNGADYSSHVFVACRTT